MKEFSWKPKGFQTQQLRFSGDFCTSFIRKQKKIILQHDCFRGGTTWLWPKGRKRCGILIDKPCHCVIPYVVNITFFFQDAFNSVRLWISHSYCFSPQISILTFFFRQINLLFLNNNNNLCHFLFPVEE